MLHQFDIAQKCDEWTDGITTAYATLTRQVKIASLVVVSFKFYS